VWNCLRWASVTKGQGSSATNVTSAGSKVQGSFSATNITYQGYALAGTRPPGTRSIIIIYLQHNPLGIRPLQVKYSFRPTNKFFEVMKKQKMSAMSSPVQQAKSYPTASKFNSYEEDSEVYDREKLGLRPNDLVFMKHDVPKKF
jgi:hypothetical protein